MHIDPQTQALLDRIQRAADKLSKGLVKKQNHFSRQFFAQTYFSLRYFK